MKKLLRKLKRVADKVFGTKADEFFWRFRHIIHDKNWAESYISPEALEHSHRKLLLQVISQYAPLEKVLEIGCASGPNLILLSQQFPETEFLGIDISKKAIEVGRKYVSERSISNVRLEASSANEIKKFSDKSFDVIFTDAMLIYIGPEKIKEILKEIIRVAKKAVILNEWHTNERDSLYYDNWTHNYKRLFSKLTPNTKTKLTKITTDTWSGNWTKYGYIIEVELNS